MTHSLQALLRAIAAGVGVSLLLGACETTDAVPAPTPQQWPKHCENGEQDRNEGGVDCGGAECDRCPIGSTCLTANDCRDGVCQQGFCESARCANAILDSGESDVDCGGPSCLPCAPQRFCNFGDDCDSGVCAERRCREAACDDGVLNGDEAEVDCGGSCSGCRSGTPCSDGRSCASGSCLEGRCQASCGQGSAECDGNFDDECETDTTSDVANCGACNQACALDHASARCENSHCAIATCEEGFADCNGELEDGCEVDLLRDAEHCGDCDVACSDAHATPACSDGTCALTCELGFDDCNHVEDDGCEIEIATDPENCGHCGSSCRADQGEATCREGECKTG